MSNYSVLTSQLDAAARIKTIPTSIHALKQKLKGSNTKVIKVKI